MVTANEKQEGGKHYKKLTIQPWDYIVSNGIGYLDGTAIKYLSRWQDKGGVEDLKKAIHFIEKLIEVENGKCNKDAGSSSEADAIRCNDDYCFICNHELIRVGEMVWCKYCNDQENP